MIYRLIFLLSVLIVSSCDSDGTFDARPPVCSAEWYQSVEAKLQVGDSEGHGPDIGSPEWRSVVEFKLGIRGDPGIPSRETDEWCTFIDEQMALSE